MATKPPTSWVLPAVFWSDLWSSTGRLSREKLAMKNQRVHWLFSEGYSNFIWLVVGPPLWKIWTSIGMIIPNIWENKKCSKPPTREASYRLFGVASTATQRRHRDEHTAQTTSLRHLAVLGKIMRIYLAENLPSKGSFTNNSDALPCENLCFIYLLVI